VTAVYLMTFIAGLLLGVLVMIYGVERPREENPASERSFRLSPAVAVPFLVIFGAVGYILTGQQTSSAASRFAISIAVAIVAAVVAARLVRKWWAVTPEHDVDDERYVLQGHLACVTKPIADGVEGEVSFEIGNEHRVLRARGVDQSALAPGTDVVIERIEDDLAFVEDWKEVEKRL